LNFIIRLPGSTIILLMRKFSVGIFLFLSFSALSQELYIFSEPASNIPAKSMMIKLTSHFVSYDRVFARSALRLMPEVRMGLHKKFMLDIGGSFSNMHTSHFDGESIFVYAKYRFLSLDDVHKHFRMAFFGEASHTNAPFHYDEISLMGDKSGAEVGLIATELLNKLALSLSVSHTQLLDSSRYNHIVYVPTRNYKAMNYSLSGGYLLFPKEYTDYRQINVNLYLELLTQQALDLHTYYFDFAPAVQFIFSSNTKLNFSYRFQWSGNMQRMSKDSWVISFERSFLNVFSKRKK